MHKITNFIASSSEHTRKIIAGIILALAGILLFFAWTAGVSARLPLLGSEFDNLSALPTAPAPQETQPQDNGALVPSTSLGRQGATAVSPMKGLIDSFQDLVRLFRGEEYPAVSNSSSVASSSSARPIDELFNKISDETPPATSTATSTEDLPGL